MARNRRRRWDDFEPPPAATPGEYQKNMNEVIRASNKTGLTILQMMQNDLDVAWGAWLDLGESAKRDVVRGRIRGLAQGIATVTSPFSRVNMGGDSAEWIRVIKRTERESLDRVRAKRGRNGGESNGG